MKKILICSFILSCLVAPIQAMEKFPEPSPPEPEIYRESFNDIENVLNQNPNLSLDSESLSTRVFEIFKEKLKKCDDNESQRRLISQAKKLMKTIFEHGEDVNKLGMVAQVGLVAGVVQSYFLPDQPRYHLLYAVSRSQLEEKIQKDFIAFLIDNGADPTARYIRRPLVPEKNEFSEFTVSVLKALKTPLARYMEICFENAHNQK